MFATEERVPGHLQRRTCLAQAPLIQRCSKSNRGFDSSGQLPLPQRALQRSVGHIPLVSREA